MTKYLVLLVVLCSLGAAATNVFAATYSTGATITQIVNYNGFPANGGDVVIYATGGSVTTCQTGFWMAKDDPSFNSILALALWAKTSNNGQISVIVDDSKLWGGGVPKVCHIYSLSIQ